MKHVQLQEILFDISLCNRGLISWILKVLNRAGFVEWNGKTTNKSLNAKN